MKFNWWQILVISIIGAIVFTYISTFFYREEIALTTAGQFTKEEALRMNLKTDTYYGWPSTIFWGGLGIPKVNSLAP